MTITNTSNRSAHAGDGVTTTFAHSKRFLAAADLKVYVVTAGVPDLKALTTDYSVAGVGDDAGGSITFTTAPASGTSVIILTDPANTQLTGYDDTDPFPAESTEDALDKLTLEVQALREISGRSVTADVDGVGVTLPEPDAGAVLGWSGAGALVNLTEIEGVTVPTGAAWNSLRWNAAGAALENEADAVVAADMAELQAVVAAGRAARIVPEGTYTFSTPWTIPSGARILGDAPITYTGSGSGAFLTIEDDVRIEVLDITSPDASGEAGPHILIGADFKCGLLKLTASMGTGNSPHVQIYPTGMHIDMVWSEGHARPLSIRDPDAITNTRVGGYLGTFVAKTVVQGFNMKGVTDMIVGRVFVQGRHAAADGDAGQNGILIQNCARFQIGPCYIEDASEHAIRIASDPGGQAPDDWSIESIHAVWKDKTFGGSALKINGQLIARRGSVGRIHMTGPWGAADVVTGNRGAARLSHCRDIHIGTIATDSSDTFSCFNVLEMNDAARINVGEIDVRNPYNSAITLSDNQDAGGEGLDANDVGDIYVGALRGIMGASTADGAINIGFSDANVGDISVLGIDLSLATGQDLISVVTIATTAGGRRLFHGMVRDVSPTFTNVPDDDTWRCDLTYDGVRYIGRVAQADFRRGALLLSAAAFDASDTTANYSGLTIHAAQAAAGNGNYGGALIFSRPGAGRRGGAIALKQNTASANQTRMDFYVGSSGIASDDLAIAATLDHTGAMNLPAVAGEYRIAGTKVVGTRQAAITDPASTTAGNNAAIISILAALRAHGLIET